MPAEFEVQADNLHKVYKQVQEIGGGALRKELTKAIREATKPMKEAVKRSALEHLPKRGGLAQKVSRTRVSNQVKTGRLSAGVQLRGNNPYQIKRMDEGVLRHRVFGTDTWVNQSVPPGWWSEPLQKSAPQVRKSIQDALGDMARKIG